MNLLSFIFSSDRRRYAITLGFVTLALLGGTVMLTFAGYRFRWVDPVNLALYDYQMKKLSEEPAVDIAFVGDSALGNTIDAALFSRIGVRPAVNLALTGAYGYGGSYNMMRHLLKHQRPRVVVLLHTVDMMARPNTVTGFHLTSDGLDFTEISPVDLLKIYLNLDTVKKVLRCGRDACWRDDQRVQMVNDYMPQGLWGERPPSYEEVHRNPLLPDHIRSGKTHYLREIARLCKRWGILCIYAHGPVFEAYCQASANYLEHATAAIRAAGITVVEGTPVCVPQTHLGDTEDHVKPRLKSSYTLHYYTLLAPYIGDNSAGRRPLAQR